MPEGSSGHGGLDLPHPGAARPAGHPGVAGRHSAVRDFDRGDPRSADLGASGARDRRRADDPGDAARVRPGADPHGRRDHGAVELPARAARHGDHWLRRRGVRCRHERRGRGRGASAWPQHHALVPRELEPGNSRGGRHRLGGGVRRGACARASRADGSRLGGRCGRRAALAARAHHRGGGAGAPPRLPRADGDLARPAHSADRPDRARHGLHRGQRERLARPRADRCA